MPSRRTPAYAPPNDRAAVGAFGEEATLELYRSQGFDLLERNWRCSAGEVDLILGRDDLVVFCEVKTRRSSGLGGGYEAVTHRKERKLRALAEIYLRPRPAARSIRFDVASVYVSANGRPSVELFEDAF
jgi:putative endonuclease